MIDGRTKVCGLIGNPVEHTMSPVIHNTLAKHYGHNLVYVPLLTNQEQLREAVFGAKSMHFLGCNVTVPFKEKVIALLDEVDDTARQIGAVNTLVQCKNGLKGYNTDMPGLLRAMKSDGVSLEGEKVLVLGAGGVARAVAMMLSQEKVEQFIILNRSKEKAVRLAEEFGGIGMGLEEISLLSDKDYIVIQATSVGMYPNCDDLLIQDLDFYRKIKVGYDIIFNPFDTAFMKEVRKAGGKAYNGLKMLLYQGVIAYELWNDMQVDEEIAIEIYEKMCKMMEKKNG